MSGSLLWDRSNFATGLIVLATDTATDTRTPEETRQDVHRLLALRPPTDPVTGLMIYDTRQAAQYRKALQGIVRRYGTIESFQDAMRDSGIRPEQQLAKAAAPVVPNVMAGPPALSAEASLARFAQSMMAPGPPINPNAPGPQGAPGGTVPGMPAPMQPGGPLPATAGVPQSARPPAGIPRRGTGTVL